MQVSEAKLRALQPIFDKFDKDESGFIEFEELVEMLRALGFNPPEHRIKDIMEDYDEDRNGNLSFGEFVDVWRIYCAEASTEMDLLRKAFAFFDYVRHLSNAYFPLAPSVQTAARWQRRPAQLAASTASHETHCEHAWRNGGL